MKRRDELLVGVTMLVFVAVVVGGALWLSEAYLGPGGAFQSARFRTVGGLSVGNPVVLRGVRVGRVEELRLGDGNWVEAVLQIYPGVTVPPSPAIVAASASLFGEWQASIINRDEVTLDDPNIQRQLEEAQAVGEDAWPGATLPDIGQLTAEAGRIATDIATLSSRIETAFDEEAVENLQRSVRDFGEVADEISRFASEQTEVLGEVTENVRVTTGVVSQTATSFQRTMARIDAATADGRLDTIMTNTAELSTDLRQAVRGFRDVVNSNQASIDRIIGGADSVISRLQGGDGTIGRLVADSTLYVEASKAVAEFRELLADIRANPRKYFKFSVF